MRSVPVVSTTPSSASPTLRQRMITEMCVRGLSPRTQESYVHAVRTLAAFYMRPPPSSPRPDRRRPVYALRPVPCPTRGRAQAARGAVPGQGDHVPHGQGPPASRAGQHAARLGTLRFQRAP